MGIFSHLVWAKVARTWLNFSWEKSTPCLKIMKLFYLVREYVKTRSRSSERRAHISMHVSLPWMPSMYFSWQELVARPCWIRFSAVNGFFIPKRKNCPFVTEKTQLTQNWNAFGVESAHLCISMPCFMGHFLVPRILCPNPIDCLLCAQSI